MVTSWGGIRLAIIVAMGIRVVVLHRQEQESGRRALMGHSGRGLYKFTDACIVCVSVLATYLLHACKRLGA